MKGRVMLVMFSAILAGNLLLEAKLSAEEPNASEITTLKKRFPRQSYSVADTSPGFTHYQDMGSAVKPIVVLVHGVSGPLCVWDHNIDALTGAGYRIIRYDLLGRGLSERLIGTEYGLSVYLEQLETLLSKLHVSQPIYLVGSSFGAIVSTEYTLRHPERIKGLVLIGPAGFPIKVPPMAKLRKTPVLGDYIFRHFGTKVILAQNRKYFVDRNPPEEFWSYFTAQLSVNGTKEAMDSTMRYSPVQSYVDSYRRLGKTNVAVGVIWGRQDATFPYENHVTLLQAVPQAKLVTIENSAHLPQYERPESANKAILGFFSDFSSDDRKN